MPKECNKEKLHKLLITLFWKIVLSTAREVKHVMRQKLRAVLKFKFPSIKKKKKKQLKDTINKFAGYQKLIMVIRPLHDWNFAGCGNKKSSRYTRYISLKPPGKSSTTSKRVDGLLYWFILKQLLYVRQVSTQPCYCLLASQIQYSPWYLRSCFCYSIFLLNILFSVWLNKTLQRRHDSAG